VTKILMRLNHYHCIWWIFKCQMGRFNGFLIAKKGDYYIIFIKCQMGRFNGILSAKKGDYYIILSSSKWGYSMKF